MTHDKPARSRRGKSGGVGECRMNMVIRRHQDDYDHILTITRPGREAELAEAEQNHGPALIARPRDEQPVDGQPVDGQPAIGEEDRAISPCREHDGCSDG